MAARKTADVPYPNMYATAEEAKADIKKLVSIRSHSAVLHATLLSCEGLHAVTQADR